MAASTSPIVLVPSRRGRTNRSSGSRSSGWWRRFVANSPREAWWREIGTATGFSGRYCGDGDGEEMRRHGLRDDGLVKQLAQDGQRRHLAARSAGGFGENRASRTRSRESRARRRRGRGAGREVARSPVVRVRVPARRETLLARGERVGRRIEGPDERAESASLEPVWEPGRLASESPAWQKRLRRNRPFRRKSRYCSRSIRFVAKRSRTFQTSGARISSEVPQRSSVTYWRPCRATRSTISEK